MALPKHYHETVARIADAFMAVRRRTGGHYERQRASVALLDTVFVGDDARLMAAIGAAVAIDLYERYSATDMRAWSEYLARYGLLYRRKPNG